MVPPRCFDYDFIPLYTSMPHMQAIPLCYYAFVLNCIYMSLLLSLLIPYVLTHTSVNWPSYTSVLPCIPGWTYHTYWLVFYPLYMCVCVCVNECPMPSTFYLMYLYVVLIAMSFDLRYDICASC